LQQLVSIFATNTKKIQNQDNLAPTLAVGNCQLPLKIFTKKQISHDFSLQYPLI